MTADELKNLEAILHSPSYRLAEQDTDFLKLAELRPVRLQLELLKPEMTLEPSRRSARRSSCSAARRSSSDQMPRHRLSKAREAAVAAPEIATAASP